ncbi:hypothetical protein GCM10027084_10370 [Pseudoxanthomonas sangjuensis]|uniref:hypothetical protein n=1 Tax=Pseudoxanthomonas sangjuensis TaxID=1503750 RepID=UPI00139078F4|nr:hypothetical protein [Pseudoxanthomonas sangjuensis]KAF1708070.1 hypothetical protein CSC71_11990 [Pseudoxanthomonas sangjuensis]
MADLILKNIDPVLNERILRLSVARRWDARETVIRLLEQGLLVIENEVHGNFDNDEASALSEAIAALKQVSAVGSFS